MRYDLDSCARSLRDGHHASHEGSWFIPRSVTKGNTLQFVTIIVTYHTYYLPMHAMHDQCHD